MVAATTDERPQSEPFGYIYILLNPTSRGNQFKIGMTTKRPEQRAKEISAATGVPLPFEVLYEARVKDCVRAERLIHQKLAAFRIANNREFFELSLKEAIVALNEVAAEIGEAGPEVVSERDELKPPLPVSDIELTVSSEGRARNGRSSARNRSSRSASFQDHVQYTDAPRQKLLERLREYILSLNHSLTHGETITPAQRIAYRIPGGTIFIEVKVQKSAILLRLVETDADAGHLVVEKIPETHGWRDLKDQLRLLTVDDLAAALPVASRCRSSLPSCSRQTAASLVWLMRILAASIVSAVMSAVAVHREVQAWPRRPGGSLCASSHRTRARVSRNRQKPGTPSVASWTGDAMRFAEAAYRLEGPPIANDDRRT